MICFFLFLFFSVNIFFVFFTFFTLPQVHSPEFESIPDMFAGMMKHMHMRMRPHPDPTRLRCFKRELLRGREDCMYFPFQIFLQAHMHTHFPRAHTCACVRTSAPRGCAVLSEKLMQGQYVSDVFDESYFFEKHRTRIISTLKYASCTNAFMCQHVHTTISSSMMLIVFFLSLICTNPL